MDALIERVVTTNKQLEKVKPVLQRPPMYRVVLLNDDFTPMDFVVELLQELFYFNSETANQIMLQIHHSGKGICGIYSFDIAETKVALVNEFARLHEHPLLCAMEKA